MSVEDTTFRLRPEGENDVVRAYEKAERAAQQAGKGAQGAAGGFGLVGKASQNAGRQMGGLVNVAAEMTYSFSTAIPPLRAVGTQMAMMGGSAYQLGAAFGPVGVAVGVLVGVLPTLVMWLSSTSDELDETSAAAEQAARSFDDVVRAARGAASARALGSRMAMGVADPVEMQAELERRQAELAAIRGALPDVTTAARTTLDPTRRRDAEESERNLRRHEEFLANEVTRLTEAVEDVTAEMQEGSGEDAEFIMRQQLEALPEDSEEAARLRRLLGIADPRSRRSRQSRRSSSPDIMDVDAALAGLDEIEMRTQIRPGVRRDLAAQRDFGQRAGRAGNEIERMLADTERTAQEIDRLGDAMDRAAERVEERQLELAENARDASEDFRDAWVDGVDDVIDAYHEMNRAAKLAGQEQADAWDLAGAVTLGTLADMASGIKEDAIGALESSVDAWVDGSKTMGEAAEDMAKGIVSALVKRSIVMVAVELAEAVTSLAAYDYAGAASHFGAMALWAGVGAVAGGVGLATGAIGGGGGAGGQAPRAERRFETDDDRGSGGIGSLTINVGTGLPISTDADIGRAVQRALDEVGLRDG